MTFTDAAFTNGGAADITNHTKSDLSIAFLDKKSGAGNAITLGGSDDYIQTNYSGILGSADRTIEAWIKTTGVGAAIVSYGKGLNGEQFTFRLVGGKLQVLVGGGNIKTIATLNDGTWHHVACVMNGATNVNEILLYVDGELQSTTNSSRTINTTADINARIGINLTEGNDFLGEIDEVRIWDDARTQDEIREHMHLTLAGTESNLVAYFPFNSTLDGVIDFSSGGYTGTFQGDVAKTTSTAPLGIGTSTHQTISSTGTYTYSSTVTDIELDITFGTAPHGEIVVNYIEGTPLGTVPTGNLPSGYWIVENYGTNTGLNMTMRFDFPDGSVTSSTLADYALHKRGTNEAGAWTEVSSAASAVNTTAGSNYIEFSSIDGFSMIIPSSSSSPLPVELLFFDAVLNSDNDVVLTWQTASETNNHGFDIERSVDDLEWENIGFVFGNGTTDEVSDYEFVDNLDLAGLEDLQSLHLYYRLIAN